MSMLSIGDLAQTFVQRRAGVQLNAELSRLGTELTTGLRTQIGTATAGDTGPVAGIGRSRAALAAYGTATSEAALFAAGTQAALARMAQQTEQVASVALSTRRGSDPTGLDVAARDARDAFRVMVGALGTTLSGRSLFGGDRTDTAPLVAADVMLADLVALASTALTAGDVIATVDDYFSDTGGFMSTAYLGSDTDLAPMRVSPDETVEPGVRADDPALREMLSATAKLALLDMGIGAGNPVLRSGVGVLAGDALLAVPQRLTLLQAHVGTAQERIETARTRNAGEDTALQLALFDMIGADPYETATRLERARGQIEALYTVTARMSRLSLTNYL